MKKFTKIMSVLLAIIMVIGMLPSVAYAATNGVEAPATTDVCEHNYICAGRQSETCTKDGYHCYYSLFNLIS